VNEQDRREAQQLFKKLNVSEASAAGLLAILEDLSKPATAPTAPNSAEATSVKPLAWGAKVSSTFRSFVRQMAEDFSTPEYKLDPDWFMACMAFETMETFSPSVRPRRKDGSLVSTAVGLIQFLEAIARELNTTTAKLAAMTAEEQLKFVWLYFRNRIRERGPLKNLEDCYMAIHWPAAVGKPLDSVMYVKGSSAFSANAGLDLNHDGRITKAEAGSLVRAKLARGRLPENQA
jgi:hypothetical protein